MYWKMKKPLTDAGGEHRAKPQRYRGVGGSVSNAFLRLLVPLVAMLITSSCSSSSSSAVWVAAASPLLQPVVLINCGSDAEYIDSEGRVWEADTENQYFAAGEPTNRTSGQPRQTALDINGTTDDALYQSSRLFKRRKPSPYLYQISLPTNGEFVVELHWAEIDPSKTAVGDRIFDVVLQGSVLFEDFDIVDAAGGAYTATTLSAMVVVEQDGILSIELEQKKFNPIIAAIGVFEAPQPQVEAIARINCGGPALVDSAGSFWDADTHYQPAEPDSLSIQTGANTDILGTDEDALYRSARMFRRNRPGPYLYQVPVPAAGDYNLVLHFAEINPNRSEIGKRTFDVLVEGTVLESKYDIFETAGAGFTAVTLSTSVFVAGETLTVELDKVKFNPILAAIEVFGNASPEQPPSNPPFAAPTASVEPSGAPSPKPSISPSFLPSAALPLNPSAVPTASVEPSWESSLSPSPSHHPSTSPSIDSSEEPSSEPSLNPSPLPAAMPSWEPSTSHHPSIPPSVDPSAAPSSGPAASPSAAPLLILPSQTPTYSAMPSSTAAPVGAPDWLEVQTSGSLDNRHEACFVFVPTNNKAYLIGGRGNPPVNVYDPSTREWSVEPGPGQQLHHMQCVVADDKIWIVSAWKFNCCNEKNVRDIWIYDTIAKNWTTKAGLPKARRRGSSAAVLHNREIYVVGGARGGHGSERETLAWFDKYSIDDDEWAPVGSLPDAPHARDHTGGAVVGVGGGQRLCVAGGRNGGFNDTVLPTDCYNFATGTWTVEADIPQGRAGSAFGQTCDFKLMVAGGEGYGQAWDQVDVFDGTAWETIASLETARHGTGLAVDCACQQIHIASGSGSQGGSPELYSTETLFPSGTDVVCP